MSLKPCMPAARPELCVAAVEASGCHCCCYGRRTIGSIGNQLGCSRRNHQFEHSLRLPDCVQAAVSYLSRRPLASHEGMDVGLDSSISLIAL